MSLRDLWANLGFVQAWQKQRPQPRAALTSGELGAAYERLKAATEGDVALRKDLDKLKSTAESGLQISRWSRRFVFGFGVAKAIEEWFYAFDSADPDKPLLARIPRDETSNVAAKWVWFGFFTTLVGVVFSLSVSGITAVFLYHQTNILAQQAANTRETNTNAQRVQYTQILYDEKCEPEAVETASETLEDNPKIKRVCRPIYNPRIRTEAVKALLELERAVSERPDISSAQLRYVALEGIDLSYADLSYADLIWTNLRRVNFRSAYLRGANLRYADLNGADLSDADLTDATITQLQLNIACGNENTKLPKKNLKIELCPTH